MFFDFEIIYLAWSFSDILSKISTIWFYIWAVCDSIESVLRIAVTLKS